MNFYSHLPSIFVVTKTGTKLQFMAGVYSTDDKEEIQLLHEVMKINPGLISTTQQPLVKNDSVPLREVGMAAPKPSGVGMVNSAALAALSKDSNAAKA